MRVGEGGPLAVEEVLPFEDGEDAVEELDQPAERAAVDLAAVFAVLAAGHLLIAGVALAVVVGVGVVACGGDGFSACMACIVFAYINLLPIF